MASTKIATVEITCNTKRAKAAIKEYERLASEAMANLANLTRIVNDNQKKGIKITEEQAKEMKKLEEDIKTYTSAQQRGIDDMKKAKEVLNDLANSSIKEVNKAIRDMTKSMNGMRDISGIRKVQGDIDTLRKSLVEKLKPAVGEVMKDLKNVNNLSFDKLQQNIETLRNKWNSMTEAQRNGVNGRGISNAITTFEAQAAVVKNGPAGTSSIDRMTTEQLQSERSRLMQAYNATEGSAMHATISKEYLDRLHQVNQELKVRADKEREADKAAKERISTQQKEAQVQSVLSRLNNGQAVSLKELKDAYATLKDGMEKALNTGVGVATTYRSNMRDVEQAMKNIQTTVNDLDINKVFRDIDSQSLETLEATLRKVKENASQIKVGDTAGIDEAAQQMDVLEKKIAEVKARMTEYSSLAERGMNAHKTLANIENASYEDLENTLKFLEERHKKLQGTETKRQQQSIANQDKIKKRMKEMRGELLSEEEIRKRVAQTGKYSAAQLQQAYDSLKVKLMSLRSEEREAIRETQKQMKTLQKEIEGVQGRVSGLTKVWTTAVRNIGTYVGVFAGFNYVKGKIEEVIKKNYELSDSLTNVRKVSGLTMDDINQLYTNISKIDTRNTINTLTNLAYQGGKLGIQEYGGVEALTGFVRAAEQVQAALGEDLGDQALPALAKLTENMGLIKSMGVEQAMQKTASAIFALSTSSVSTGQGIVDFSKRLMPVAKSAGVATDELLGLASATESSGLAAEVASTAFVKMFPSIYKNAEALEKYLNISPGAIREMYDQNRAMDAMVMIFDKMQDMGNLNKYPEIFKLLGSEGARMNTVMSAMANNVDMLRTHLNTSNKAFEEGVAVINEYNLQSNSAAGILERANNIWEKAFVNPEGVDMVKELAQAWYMLSDHVAKSDTWMTTFRTTLKSVETIVSLLIILLPALVRIMMFTGVVNTVKYLVVNFQNMRTAILAAASAQGKLNAAMRANIFSFLIGGGLALISMFWDLYKIIDKDAKATAKLTQEEQDLADAQKTVGEYTKKEVGHLDALYKAATDTLQPMEKRVQWVKQLKQEFPDYFKDLSDEAILTGKAADKYEALAQSLIKAAKARAYKDKMEKISEESVQLQEEVDNDLDYLNQNEARYKREKSAQQNRLSNPNPGAAIFGTTAALAQQQTYQANETFIYDYEQAENRVLQKQAQIGKNDERIKKLAASAMENTPTPKPQFEPGSGGGGGGGGAGTNKELNAEMRDEQIKAKALIDNIKNYYQRQINALNELANDTNMSEGDLKGRLDRLQEHMNDALANARKAIGGEKNEWEAFKAKMREDLYEQTDEEGYNFSEQLLNYVMENQLNELRDMILKLSETLNKRGDVLLDQILRKATEDEAKNIKQVTDQRKLLEKELLEMNYTGKVDRDSMSTMENLGLGGLSDNQTKKLQTWKQTGDTEAAKEFFTNREKLWYQMYAEAREHIADIINSPVENKGDEDRLLRILFGENYQETLQGSEVEGFLNMTLDQWKVFYIKLLNYNDQWNDAQRKFYEDNKKRQDYLFNNDSTTLEIKSDVKNLETESAQRKWTGQDKGTNFSQLAGFSNINEDPELVRLMLLEEQAQRYYEKMEELRQQDLVSQEMVNDAKTAMDEAEKNRQQELMNLIDDHISKLSQWTEPIQTFATDVGTAMGEALASGESMAEGMQNALKSLVKSWGESTIQILKDLMMQQLRQKLVGKTMVKETKKTQGEMTETTEEGGENRLKATTLLETGTASVMQTVGQQMMQQKQAQDSAQAGQDASRVTGETMMGIAGAAARIMETLGPWGAPLIAVVTALLMGLLSMALGALGGGSKSSSSNDKAATKIKLKSGMLTYDEGNVQTVVGNDGRVYRAKEQRSLPSGVSMITSPIATTVNGQEALVGERGPEIVIGRKTTRAIQMNRPDLLRDLALIDRGITTRKVRAFDEGNLSDLASAIRPADDSAGTQTADGSQNERDQMLIQTMQQMLPLMQNMTYLLQNPVAPNINMYGENGLHKKLKQADQFMKRYGD